MGRLANPEFVGVLECSSDQLSQKQDALSCMCRLGGGELQVEWLCVMRASCVAAGDLSGRLDCPGERLGLRRMPKNLDEWKMS
jgi:hypothetical protein